MTNALKPCPFCGGRAKTVKGSADQPNWRGTFWRVFCVSCQSRQLFHKAEAEAIAAWNRRTGDHSQEV